MVVSNLANKSFHSQIKKYKVSYHTQRRWLKESLKDEVFNFNKEKKKTLLLF